MPPASDTIDGSIRSNELPLGSLYTLKFSFSRLSADSFLGHPAESLLQTNGGDTMNTNQDRYLAGEPLNSQDLQSERLACLAHPCGGETIYLNTGDVDRYVRDPDGFAAEHFGLSKSDYREWVFHGGHALCAAQTKAGKPCRNFVTRHGTDAAEWKAAHRSEYCGSHRHLG